MILSNQFYCGFSQNVLEKLLAQMQQICARATSFQRPLVNYVDILFLLSITNEIKMNYCTAQISNKGVDKSGKKVQ